MTRFIVLRHGETEWNVAARIQGHGDSALTARGLAQAQSLAERIARESFDLLVSSDLGRAHQTAAMIAKRTHHPLIADPRLREQSFGEGEGLSYEEVGRRYPNAFSPLRERNPDYAIPGGESRRAFHERAIGAFDAMAREHEGRRIVVVTHGGVLAALYRFINGIALSTPHGVPITNAALNLIACTDGCWSIDAWNDEAHLETADPFEEA